MRDTQSTSNYFEFAINSTKETIQMCNDLIEEGKGIKVKIYGTLHYEYLSLTKLNYSIGKPIEEVKEAYIQSLQADLVKIPMEKGDPDYAHEQLNGYIGIFEDYLEMLCLGILLNVDRKLLQEYRVLLEEFRGKDLLLENIWSLFLSHPLEKNRTKLLYSKSYGKLLEVFGDDSSHEVEKLKAYSSEWMKTKRTNTWYGNLKLSKTGVNSAYKGYWNFEAAAIAALCGFTSTQFHGMKYFPVELLEYYEANKN